MISSSSMAVSMSTATLSTSSFNTSSKNNSLRNVLCKIPSLDFASIKLISNSSPLKIIESALPLAASLSIVLWSNPANAGFLSGSKGLESVPGPELPKIDFLNKWNDENQKRYADLDTKFKSSTVLKELLEKSKVNKERNKKEIQDKYCLRGAEWGVGDCSTQGMTEEEKEAFIAMLKKTVGE